MLQKMWYCQKMITNNKIATIYMVKIDIGKLKSLDVLKSRPKLTASDAASNDFFGNSVAFSKDGSVLAIGAYGDDDNGQDGSGSVYLYSGSGTNWTEIKKLTASDADAGDNFGSSVAFSKDGNVLAIGAEDDDDNGVSGSGSVYLYSGSGTNWTEIKKLTASDAASNDNFGSSVAFSNNGLLAIGAYQDDSNKGSVYLFSGSGTNWTEIKKLTASDAAAGDNFGSSVAFSNNGLLAVGAYLDHNNGQNDSGSVYLFSGSGTNWTQQTKLTASDADTSDFFGYSLAFSNNGILAVGAFGDDDNGLSTSGSVYLFSGSGTNWTEIKKITAYDAATGDYFGSSVAFSNNGLLAIGAYLDDDNGQAGSGSVYLYDLPLVKNKTKKKSLIQLSDSEVINYMEGDEYNGTTILGIVKTENANGDKINYLILDNDPNNVYGQLLKIKNDNTISRTEKIAIYKNYQGIYGFSPEINNYIESLLNN